MVNVFRILGPILVIGLILLIVKQSKKTEAEIVEYDLIVSIKVEPAPNIIQHAKIKEAAAWEVYGKGVFRGKSVLKKDEMKALLKKELCLTEENIIVVDATDSFIKSKT